MGCVEIGRVGKSTTAHRLRKTVKEGGGGRFLPGSGKEISSQLYFLDNMV